MICSVYAWVMGLGHGTEEGPLDIGQDNMFLGFVRQQSLRKNPAVVILRQVWRA
ncbi:MAG: hypothetical protein HC934_05005 [Acaryochloridaceae cyanobacterium SU_2_1]|nr:hypothetical protein [Acaryochloridaceae cyanobacterium SU_2_1]NJM95142.1 hypothetical protein [Acaryochloridaceae cyanobacterium CSU_5_19]